MIKTINKYFVFLCILIPLLTFHSAGFSSDNGPHPIHSHLPFPQDISGLEALGIRSSAHMYRWAQKYCVKNYSGSECFKSAYCNWWAAMAQRLYEPDPFTGEWVYKSYNYGIAFANCRGEWNYFKEVSERYADDIIESTLKDVKLIVNISSTKVNICDIVTVWPSVSYTLGRTKNETVFPVESIIWNAGSGLRPWASMGLPESSISSHGQGSGAKLYSTIKEGTWNIRATLPQVLSPKVLFQTKEPKVWEKAVANSMSGLSAEVKITVLPPTVKKIVLVPASAMVNAGSSFTFRDVIVTFKENCVKEKRLGEIKGDLSWSAKKGKMKGNVYSPPELKPVSLKITSPSHPDLRTRPCETVLFEAMPKFEYMIDSATVTYKGKSKSADVVVEPPPIRLRTSDISWPKSGPSLFIQEAKDYDIKAQHNSSGVSASVKLKVEKPRIKNIEVIPSTKKLYIFQSATFTAKAHFEESCLKPKPIKVTWKPEGIIGSSYTYKPKKPEGSKTIIAQYTDPETGELFEGKAEVTIPWPQLVIKPDKSEIKIDQTLNFEAYWMTGHEAWIAEDIEWKPSKSITPKICGKLPVKATHKKSGKTVTKNLKVVADCISIRKRLADIRNPKSDPDHIQESKKWLRARLELLKEKKCDCGVPIDKLLKDIKTIASDISGKWDTNLGQMTLNKKGDSITGTYSSTKISSIVDTGTITGKIKGRTFTGFWIKTKSATKCQSQKNGSYYWGGIKFKFSEAFTKFDGSWSYCAGGGGGSWNGSRSSK